MLERILASGSLPVLVAALLVAGFGVPIPEDPILLTAGLLAHRGILPAWLVLMVIYASVLTADCVIFLIARHFGESLLERPLFRSIFTPRRRDHVHNLFQKHGPRAVFIGRHIAGLRAVVFATAGMEGMKFATFLIWDGMAAMISVPVMFSLGYFFSAHLTAIEHGIARTEHWIAAILAFIALVTWLVWSLRTSRRK